MGTITVEKCVGKNETRNSVELSQMKLKVNNWHNVKSIVKKKIPFFQNFE